MISVMTGGFLVANGIAMCVGGIAFQRRRRVQCRILYRRGFVGSTGDNLASPGKDLSKAVVNWEPDRRMAYRASYWAWSLVAVGSVFRMPVLVAGGGLLTSFWWIPCFRDSVRKMVVRRRPTVGGLMAGGAAFMLVFQMNLYAASVFNLFQVGRRFSKIAAGQSRRLLAEVFAGEKATAWVCCEGVELAVPFRSLRGDDLIVVKAGAFVPVDGLVVEGEARVNQHLLSAEREGVLKSVGKTVFASSYVESGQLVIRSVLLDSEN